LGSRKINLTREYDDIDLTAGDFAAEDRRQQRRRPSTSARQTGKTKRRRPPRTAGDQAFQCRRCHQFIGAPIVGGRHRNHCPNCLHSLHVDLKRPGDRRGTCESLMTPRGLIVRRNGEQMILQECLGCGKTQPTRVAADDNTVLLMRLAPIGVAVSDIDAAEVDAAKDIA